MAEKLDTQQERRPTTKLIDPETYVVCTPVNPWRTWTLPAYIRGIKRLTPQPQAVGIVTTREVFDRFFADDPLFHFVAEHPPGHLPFLERIAIGREELRKWFIHERTESIQWWIDSDIEVFEETWVLLREAMEDRRCLVLSNGYQGRERAWNWHGIGCTVVHRRVADISRFWFARGYTIDGEEANISEDLVYFSAFEWHTPDVLERIAPECRTLRATIDAAPVAHHWDGPQHEPRQEVKPAGEGEEDGADGKGEEAPRKPSGSPRPADDDAPREDGPRRGADGG